MDRAVYVGSVPYEATEHQVREFLSEVGPIKSFRLVSDKSTADGNAHGHAHKGFGFCEYHDATTAQAAIRNLDGRTLLGRKIKVDWKDKSGPNPVSKGPGTGNILDSQRARMIEADLVSKYTPAQLYDLIEDMQDMIRKDREYARDVLEQHPQLSLALVAAVNKLLSLKESNAKEQQPKVAPPGAAAPPPHAHSQWPAGPGGAGPGPMPMARPGPPGPGVGVPPPGPSAGPGPMPEYAQRFVNRFPGTMSYMAGNWHTLNEAQLAGVAQVLALNPQQIVGMPVDQQEKIKQIRGKFFSRA